MVTVYFREVRPNLKKPKEKRFSKCNQCCKFINAMRKVNIKDIDTIRSIQLERAVHMAKQKYVLLGYKMLYVGSRPRGGVISDPNFPFHVKNFSLFVTLAGN